MRHLVCIGLLAASGCAVDYQLETHLQEETTYQRCDVTSQLTRIESEFVLSFDPLGRSLRVSHTPSSTRGRWYASTQSINSEGEFKVDESPIALGTVLVGPNWAIDIEARDEDFFNEDEWATGRVLISRDEILSSQEAPIDSAIKAKLADFSPDPKDEPLAFTAHMSIEASGCEPMSAEEFSGCDFSLSGGESRDAMGELLEAITREKLAEAIGEPALELNAQSFSTFFTDERNGCDISGLHLFCRYPLWWSEIAAHRFEGMDLIATSIAVLGYSAEDQNQMLRVKVGLAPANLWSPTDSPSVRSITVLELIYDLEEEAWKWENAEFAGSTPESGAPPWCEAD
jgi:hypothetical protein